MTMNNLTGYVLSPLCVQLGVGVIAPFVSPVARAEIEQAWGMTASALHENAVELSDQLRANPVMEVSLGVWSRSHVPDRAREMLGDLLSAMPTNDAEAQKALDEWVTERTRGEITKSPVGVDPETSTAVLAALVGQMEWLNGPGKSRWVRWGDSQVEGMALACPTEATQMTADGRTVVVSLPLTHGGAFTLAFSLDHEPEALLTDMPTDLVPLTLECPMASESRAKRPGDNTVAMPTFTLSTTTNLAEDSARWGIERFVSEGAPGLDPSSMQVKATQAATITVSKQGVKAAAVTGFSVLRSAAMASQAPSILLEVDRPFAFVLSMDGFDCRLFEGVYR